MREPWMQALSTSLTKEEYAALAESNDWEILSALVMNPRVSGELFQSIISRAMDAGKVDLLRMVSGFRKIDIDFVMQNFDRLPIEVVLMNTCFSDEEREEIVEAYKRYQALI